MIRFSLSAAFLAGATLLAAPAMADDLQLHTYLLTWAAENCEAFDYAEDLLRHANIAVSDAPEDVVAEFRRKTEAGLERMFEGDKVKYCAFVADSIEQMQSKAG